MDFVRKDGNGAQKGTVTFSCISIGSLGVSFFAYLF